MITIELTAAGNLPEGIHQQTWSDFAAQFGFSLRRAAILNRVFVVLHHFAQAGITRVFIGGSFVTSKKSPKDMDVLYDTTGADPERVHPGFFDLSRDGRSAMIVMFGAEFFPTNLIEGSTDTPMLTFFQTNRDGLPVGLIEIELAALPPMKR
jgi:hypothetical protein